MKTIMYLDDSGETTVVGLTSSPEVAEKIILDSFTQTSFQKEELVKIEYEGRSIYTRRTVHEEEPDDFEYVDNDGNPIEADGSDKIEATANEEPVYEYGDGVWIIRDVKEDTLVDLSSSDFFIPETADIFEAHENIVVSQV